MTVRIPKRLYIMQRLTAILETVNAEYMNEPAVSMVGRVVRGKAVIGNELKPPLFSLIEAPRPDEEPAITAWFSQVSLEKWPILLQGFAIDDKQNPADPAYYLQAQAEEALSRITAKTSQGIKLFPDDYYLSVNGKQMITGLTVMPGVVRPAAKDVSPTAFFYTPLLISLSGHLSNPFIEI